MMCSRCEEVDEEQVVEFRQSSVVVRRCSVGSRSSYERCQRRRHRCRCQLETTGQQTAAQPSPADSIQQPATEMTSVLRHTTFVLRLTGRLHDTIVGWTGRSDWSVRLIGPTIVSCKRFVLPVGQTVGRIKHV